MTADPTWQEVVLQALNVAQTVLLAYLSMRVREQGRAIEDMRLRSHRRRRSDPHNDESPA